jgi:hypothetical protein
MTARGVSGHGRWSRSELGCLLSYGETRKGGRKRREALGVDHKRLLYCVNVNRTSLDHLLLGESADIDELSNGLSITPDGADAGRISLNIRFRTTSSQL